MEPIPSYAYVWRPYAAPDLIRRPFEAEGKPYEFVIDPWSQRWAIVVPEASRILQLANGRRRFVDIMRTVTEESPSSGLVLADAASELTDQGLLFESAAEQRAAGGPVYSSVEPIGLHIEITNACNMTCSHCYVSSGRKMPNEMTLEEIKAALEMLPPFTGKRIAISGGEPAARKECAEIVEHAALELGHDVDLYTNGKKFPERLLQRVVEINAKGLGRVRLQMSLEGATAAVNDRVRGIGSFVEAMKSLKRFQEAGQGPNVTLFVCLTKANLPQLDDIIRIGEEHDVGMVVFSQWQRQGNAASTPWAWIAPSVEEWVAAGEKILAYRNPNMLVFGNFFGDLNNDAFGRYCINSNRFPKHIYGYNVVPRVTPQGDVFADQLWVDESWIVGNVKHQTLEECFNTPKYHEQLDSFRRRADEVPECRACEWKPLCEGGSPGHTYAEFGHLRSRDLFCESRIYWFERFVEQKIATAFMTAPREVVPRTSERLAGRAEALPPVPKEKPALPVSAMVSATPVAV